jgi:hypothetical protein
MPDPIDIVQPIATAACAKVAARGIAALSDSERIAFLIWLAVGEADNGGLHAICYNSSGDYIRLFPAAFQAIGAAELFAVFGGLRSLADEIGLAQDHATRSEQHATLPEKVLAQIDVLEQRYNSSSDHAFQLLASYLGAHGAA